MKKKQSHKTLMKYATLMLATIISLAVLLQSSTQFFYSFPQNVEVSQQADEQNASSEESSTHPQWMVAVQHAPAQTSVSFTDQFYQAVEQLKLSIHLKLERIYEAPARYNYFFETLFTSIISPNAP
jgi:hypothetical protein